MTRPAAPVAVLGAGSWGTALAIHLAGVGASPRLWGRDRASIGRIAATRENARYLPGLAVPSGVTATADPAVALDGAAAVIVAVPSAFVESVIGAVRGCVPESSAVVSATKGLEPGRGRRISVLLGECLPGRPLAVLSGPSFAREVALGRPTALVVASADEELARDLQRGLAGPALRLYTNRDVIGVEIAGALKNVMAVATGLSDGIGLGENARAALITRGLAEIARLGVALGAQPGTFLGLAGLGDLVLTCTGSLSRNHALGRAVAGGKTVADVQAETPMVAEGARTVGSALALSRSAGIRMPICEEVAAVLFDGKPVADALRSLLSREPRPEDEQRQS